MLRNLISSRVGRLAACGACALAAVPALGGAADAATTLPNITPTPFVSGSSTAMPAQNKPDDIVTLGGNIYVAYQNGVGADGTPPPGQNAQSTIVEYSPAGTTLQSWLAVGRVDGLAADALTGQVIATVNEDNNSSLYVVTPGNPGLDHYSYNPPPSEINRAAGETTPNGGTDSVAVGPDGTIYIAHSNPDPGFPSTAATYVATLSGTTANLTPLFAVNATATDITTGQTVTLALTDPDSNRYVPAGSPVFGGSLIQVAQGDSQLVIVNRPNTSTQSLQRLTLTNAETPAVAPTVDDIIEIPGPGTLYSVDQGSGATQAISTSGFAPGTLVVAQPKDGGNAGQLGVVDPKTGVITHFANTFNSPKGLVFVPAAPAPVLPEAPAAALLPLGAVGIAGAAIVLRRRRRSGI